MKMRLFLMGCILLLSFGLVTAGMASAETMQNAAITPEANPDLPMVIKPAAGAESLAGNSEELVSFSAQKSGYNNSQNGTTPSHPEGAGKPNVYTWAKSASNPRLPEAGGLSISVNYAQDWVHAYTLPNVAITVTVAGKGVMVGTTDLNGEFRGWEWSWNPEGVDIVPGDNVSVIVAGLSTEVNPVGTITGNLNVNTGVISGTIQAPFGSQALSVRCDIWVENGPQPIDVPGVPADGGSYTCDFGAKGWTIQPGQTVAVLYTEPDGDQVINVFMPPWMRVNYAHDWAAGDYPAGHTFWITVTNSTGAVKATTQEASIRHGGWLGDGFETKGPWSPGKPDIQEGDWVYFTSDDGYNNSIRVGVITGTVDGLNNSIEGSIYADWWASPLIVECHAWGSPNPVPVKRTTAGSNGNPPYFCQWDPKTEWDIQPGQEVEVMYVEPDGDGVANVFQEPDMNLHLRVNYGHDWIESFYPGGHTVWITVTESDGSSVIATAQGQTGLIPWWSNNQTGFSSEYNLAWDSGIRPDMKAGNWVYGRVDNGNTAAVRLGEITGNIDQASNAISGALNTPWYTKTLNIECFPWGAPGLVPAKSSTAGPTGNPLYNCAWDPVTEWRILAGQDVGVAYNGTDGNWVANVFRLPAPHLSIKTSADGSPGEGGNFTLNVQYQNDGQAPAENTIITGTLLGGMSYISDTSGLPTSGTGKPGDPLVWKVGNLPNSGNSTQFQVFVAVTTPASNTITNSVQIETSTPYFQDDANSKQSQWSGHVVVNNTDVNVVKSAWTMDPVPSYDFVYNINVCNNGSTASSELTLTDTLPLSTTLVTWWGQNPGWTDVTSSGHKLVVSRPSIPGGWCGDVYVRVNLDASTLPGMTLANTAMIAASNDVNPGNNQATLTHNIGSPRHNLSIDKDWILGRLVPGGDLVYELSYNNNGNLPVDNVFITSTLPANTSFIDSWYDDAFGHHLVTPKIVVQGKYVVWDIGKMDNGYRGRLSIHVAIDKAAIPGQVLTHKVAITTLPIEDDYDDNTITWVETINGPGVNLRVDKQNYSWWSESTLSYEIRVYNLGTETLKNFWITDTYPVSTTFAGDWKINHGGMYTLTVDADKHQLIFWGRQIDPGGTANLGFRVNLDSSAVKKKGLTFTNHVLAPILGDVTPADNFDQVTAFTGPDLWVKKSLLGGDLTPGGVITYSLKFGNDQRGNAWWWNLQGNAILTDTLPAGVEYLSADMYYCGMVKWCSFGPNLLPGNKFVWPLWQFKGGMHNEIRLRVRIPNSATGLDTLVNQLDIGSDQSQNDGEHDYANNHDSLSLPIPLPYFTVSKQLTSNKVAGMPITYTLTVSNTGHTTGTHVDLWDWIPDWVTYGGGGSYNAGLVKWALPLVNPGSLATAWFNGTLQCTQGGLVNNKNYFVYGSDQGITSTNGAPVSFSILAPTIDVTGQASSTAINPGQSVNFTATATTNGTPLTYAWKIGTTVIGTGHQISYVFNTPGTQDVIVTVTDGCGFTDGYTITVEVGRLKMYLPVIQK